MLYYLVISPCGTPFYTYSLTKKNIDEPFKLDNMLFSGLVSAIQTLGTESTGDVVSMITFGSATAHFTKSKDEIIHVLVSQFSIPIDKAKQIHIELSQLFSRALRLYPPEDDTFLESWQIPHAEERAIFEPFFRSWVKKLGFT